MRHDDITPDLAAAVLAALRERLHAIAGDHTRSAEDVAAAAMALAENRVMAPLAAGIFAQAVVAHHFAAPSRPDRFVLAPNEERMVDAAGEAIVGAGAFGRAFVIVDRRKKHEPVWACLRSNVGGQIARMVDDALRAFGDVAHVVLVIEAGGVAQVTARDARQAEAVH